MSYAGYMNSLCFTTFFNHRQNICASYNSHICTKQPKDFQQYTLRSISCWEYQKFHNQGFSQDIRADQWDGRSPDSEASGEGCYHSGFGPYHVIIACEMLQWFHNQNKRDMAQQVPHSKHTLSLITAVWAGCSAEALCLFCSGLSCRGRGTLEWLHLTRSSLHKLRRQTKEDAWLPTGAKTDPEISSSHIAEAGKATMTDCGIFLFVVSLHCIPRWSMIYTWYGCKWACKTKLLFVAGESSCISLITTLSSVTAYIR